MINWQTIVLAVLAIYILKSDTVEKFSWKCNSRGKVAMTRPLVGRASFMPREVDGNFAQFA